MSALKLKDFVNSFRKQFVFRKSKSQKGDLSYFTAYNNEKGLKTDTWAIIVFIDLAPKYGFAAKEIRQELKIKSSLYEVLLNETPALLSPKCDDKILRQTILVKSGLVQNHILATFKVSPAA